MGDSSSCRTRIFAVGTCCARGCANSARQGTSHLHGLGIGDGSWVANDDGVEAGIRNEGDRRT